MALPVALIDTSQRPAWLGLASPVPHPLAAGQEVLLQVREMGGERRAGDRLVGELIELLHTAGVAVAAITALVVVRGPGSFTGIRSGIAAAQGLARASGVPLVGVDGLTLAALAVEPAPGEHVAAFAAGRGGRVYGALFAGREGGAMQVVEAVAERTFGEWQALCPPATCWVRAGAAVAEIATFRVPDPSARLAAAVRFAATAPPVAPEELLPLYVRDWR